MPILFLRLEGLVVFLVAMAIYFQLGGSLLLFLVLLFAPDITMAGYLRNNKIGGVSYNIGHTYLSPTVLFLISLLLDAQLGMQIAFIWGAHIGLDRMLGFGLKYSSGFRDTHLGQIGTKS